MISAQQLHALDPQTRQVMLSLMAELRAKDALIAQRLEARRQKNWAEADRIRGVLADAGVVLEDTGGQTTWRRA